MSLSSALSVALTGLQTSSAMLQLTANNISNAQTPGYTAKSATLSSTAVNGSDGGAEITSYVRATNAVLQQSFNTATSSASYLGTQDTYMKQVQTILNSNANNPALSDAIAQFASAWTQLQASPEDPTVQQAVVQAGNVFARQIKTVTAQTASLKTQVQGDARNTVTQLNNELSTVATLNQQIFTATSQNQPVGNLEDQRDQAITRISGITNVQAFSRLQGQIALYTLDGVSLLDGAPQTFTYNGSGAVLDGAGQDVTRDLTGGSLQAQIQFVATATTPSSLPGVNTIQKLQGQLVDVVKAFTNTSDFEDAYNPAGSGISNTNDFFQATGNDPSTFAVNSALIADPTTISQSTISATVGTFATNYNFTDAAAGLSLASATYASLITHVLAGFQQAANSIATQSDSAAQQQSYYQQTLSNSTGVNLDSELVNLTALQNSYAASAHVISTISQMFNELMGTI